MRELLNFNQKKATTGNFETLKLSVDISADVFQNLFNQMLSTGNFSDNMIITPVFKKKDPLKKENYKPLSVLSATLKILKSSCKSKL